MKVTLRYLDGHEQQIAIEPESGPYPTVLKIPREASVDLEAVQQRMLAPFRRAEDIRAGRTAADIAQERDDWHTFDLVDGDRMRYQERG